MRATDKSATPYRFLRFVPLLGIGLMLLATFRLYGFAYFWLDDFNNLHWVRLRTFPEAIGLLLSPSGDPFRPVGMFLYQLAYGLFDRDPRPYHWLLWALHALNVGLVYTVLKRLTNSQAGAAVGALLFVYPSVFTDVFWSFGTIFEVTGAALFFTGILVWQRKDRTWATVLLATALFILALKSKEMAITLPAVWLVQDILLRRPWSWRSASAILLPGAVGLWFGIQRLNAMREPNVNQPYYMDLRGITMGRGYALFFNELFGTNYRWQVWCIGFVFLLIVFALLRWRLVVFFQAYVFIAFLPVIFLPNHRDLFFWYFPMLGVCGLAALLVRTVADGLSSRVPALALAVVGTLLFGILGWWIFKTSRSATETRRASQQHISKDYRGFVEGVRALPPPAPEETLYFTSKPEYFDQDRLLYALELALHRTDIKAELVDQFPPGARYRLAFESPILKSVP